MSLIDKIDHPLAGVVKKIVAPFEPTALWYAPGFSSSYGYVTLDHRKHVHVGDDYLRYKIYDTPGLKQIRNWHNRLDDGRRSAENKPRYVVHFLDGVYAITVSEKYTGLVVCLLGLPDPTSTCPFPQESSV